MSRSRRLALAAALVLIAAVPWWGPAVLRPLDYFAVRRVEVIGARYLGPEVVAASLGLGDGAGVFENLDALERRVRSAGGIEAVRVTRRLPGTLVVEVREVEPVALAQGPEALVAVGRDGRPLPFDLTRAGVDAPVVARVERPVLEALATVQATDLGLFAEIAAAGSQADGVMLEVGGGRVMLAPPVEPDVVREVAAVRRDLLARRVAWRELDARFAGWIVVRRAQASAAGA